MPRNSSGVYSLPAGNPVVANTLIQVSWANPTMSDIGAALTESLDRYGRGGMLAQLKLADGTAAQPAFAFNSESSTGLWHSGAGSLLMSVLGSTVFALTASAATFSSAIAPVWAVDPVSADQLTRKSYVDTKVGAYLPLTGGVLTGPGNLQIDGNLGIGSAPGTIRLRIVGAQLTSGINLFNGATNLAFLGNVSSLNGSGTDNTVALAANSAQALAFYTSGAEAGRFAPATGYFGAGAISPQYRIDAAEPGASSATVNVLRLFASASANASARLLFGSSANLLNSAIRGITASASGGILALQTANDTGGALTDRLQLDGSGNGGFNIASPNYGAGINSIALNALTQPIWDLYVNGTRTASVTCTAAAVNIGGVTALPLNLLTSGLPRFSISATGVVTYGGIEVGYRDVPRVTGALERGKAFATAAGVTINTAAEGNLFSVYNDSAAAITLTQGAGLTLRLGGTTSTGNRTLAARGLATIWFNSASEAVASGAGVS